MEWRGGLLRRLIRLTIMAPVLEHAKQKGRLCCELD